MALSASTDFTVTRNQLIEGALRICGALAEGETPTTSQYTTGSEALNMIAKAWQADGMPLWVMKEYTLTLVASTSSYIPTSKLLKVVQAYNRNTTTNIDVPMRIITRDEYNRLGNKTSSGNPVQIWHDPGLTSSTVKVFPVPTSTEATNNQIILVYQKMFDDFDAADNNPEFPAEFYAAIKFALAYHLSFEYGVDITDRNHIQTAALILKTEALGFGTEEGSITFGVEYRGY